MKTIGLFFLIFCCTSFISLQKPSQRGAGTKPRETSQTPAPSEPPVYHVKRINKPIAINSKWNKKPWKRTKGVKLENFIRKIPAFHPSVEVKMRYDAENIYVIFKVDDQFVRSITTETGGPVWKDAAVEFFFCPDTTKSDVYFNLEINCGGTALLGYRSNKPTTADVESIEIAHSLPKVTDPEIKEAITWTLEYRIPLSTLEKYSNITRPAKGVKWKANFCKIAENNSNPHYMTWSPINDPKPNFHMPKYFGHLEFE